MRYEERKTKDWYFGSSTPSSKKPFKETARETVKKNGGGRLGHEEHGREKISREQADETQELVIGNKCPHCKGALLNKSFIERSVIARKVSFGSQSKQGALSRSVLMTIIHTAKKRLPNDALQEWLKKSLDAIAANPGVDVYSLLPLSRS